MKKHPEVPEYQDSLARSHNSLGTLYRDTGRAKEAEAAYREALAIRKPLAQRHPEVPDYQDNLAGSHNNLGNLYSDTGRLKEAEAACKKAIAIRRLLVEKHSEVPAYQDHLAASQYALGLFYSDTGRLKEAEAAYEEAAPSGKPSRKRIPRFQNIETGWKRARETMNWLAYIVPGGWHNMQPKRVGRPTANGSYLPKTALRLRAASVRSGNREDSGCRCAGKDPAWSPGDGRWIAFVRGSSAADEEVWLIASDGQHARKIADGGCPSWSADGKRVFFVRGRDSKLMVVNAGERDARPGAVMDLRGPASCRLTRRHASRICRRQPDFRHRRGHKESPNAGRYRLEGRFGSMVAGRQACRFHQLRHERRSGALDLQSQGWPSRTGNPRIVRNAGLVCGRIAAGV